MHTPEQLLEIFTEALSREKFEREPKDLYDPVAYILALGGKRIRPVMLLMSGEIFGGDVHQAMPAALGVEIFHNFSLVHDDIMDNAPLRRGKPTIHEKWGVNTAILSGDTMLTMAFEYFLRLREGIIRPALLTFSQASREVCAGQQMDMAFETDASVNVGQYLEMIRLKTAVLIGASLKIGAIVSGAGEQDAENLYQYGILNGLVFQLNDDLLDVYGDKESFGKRPYGDILANKKTYLFLKALEQGSPEDRSELLSLYSGSPLDPDEKVRKVVSIFDRLGIRELTIEKTGEFYRAACASLDAVKSDPLKKNPLASYTAQLAGRTY
jgi:geranylgeranyl diphosphate synthase type II